MYNKCCFKTCQNFLANGARNREVTARSLFLSWSFLLSLKVLFYSIGDFEQEVQGSAV